VPVVFALELSVFTLKLVEHAIFTNGIDFTTIYNIDSFERAI